jgi:hypothetical protein
MRDPKTNVLLWGFTEYVRTGNRQATRDQNFDRSMDAIVGDVKNLVTQSAAPAKP